MLQGDDLDKCPPSFDHGVVKGTLRGIRNDHGVRAVLRIAVRPELRLESKCTRIWNKKNGKKFSFMRINGPLQFLGRPQEK